MTTLEEVHELTVAIRQRQDEVVELAAVRRDKVRELRSNGVTFREIASSMGITEQVVYRILRGGSGG